MQYSWIDENEQRVTGTLPELRIAIRKGYTYLPTFSAYKNLVSTSAADQKTKDIFQLVKILKTNERLKQGCEQIYKAKNKTEKDMLKKSLPIFTPSGVFSNRKNDDLKLPNFCYQLDIDLDKNPDMKAEASLKNILRDSEIDVLFASKSLSGGIKGLLFLKELVYLDNNDWNVQNYEYAIRSAHAILTDHFDKVHKVKIDDASQKISQPCFLFNHPSMRINKKYQR